MSLNSNKELSSCDINAKSCSCSTEESFEMDLKSHWNDAYSKSETKKLGWYETFPEPSLQLIKKCNFNKEASLLNVGVGATLGLRVAHALGAVRGYAAACRDCPVPCRAPPVVVDGRTVRCSR